MIKGIPMLLLAAFVLAGSPSRAQEVATSPASLPVATPASSCAVSVAPSLPQFMPQPESRIILCGCGDFACDLKRPFASCTVDGFPGTCQSGDICPFQTGKVACFCL